MILFTKSKKWPQPLVVGLPWDSSVISGSRGGCCGKPHVIAGRKDRCNRGSRMGNKDTPSLQKTYHMYNDF